MTNYFIYKIYKRSKEINIVNYFYEIKPDQRDHYLVLYFYVVRLIAGFSSVRTTHAYVLYANCKQLLQTDNAKC